MELQSKELKEAIEVPPSLIFSRTKEVLEIEDLYSHLTNYISQIDYKLLPLFTNGKALSMPARNSKEVVESIIKAIRSYCIESLSKKLPDYNTQLVALNNTFEAVEKVIKLVTLSEERNSRNELAVHLLGNLLKQIHE